MLWNLPVVVSGKWKISKLNNGKSLTKKISILFKRILSILNSQDSFPNHVKESTWNEKVANEKDAWAGLISWVITLESLL